MRGPLLPFIPEVEDTKPLTTCHFLRIFADLQTNHCVMGIATLLKGGWPVLAGLIPLSLVGYFVWAVVYYRFLHPLAKFPGPFLASISNLWKVYECYTTDFPRRMCAVHEKYGPVVRVGPNDLIFNQPEAIPGIYKMGRKMPKSVFYNAFASIVPDVFSSRDESVSDHPHWLL